MRRTRWTKKQRVTYYGKGGWSKDEEGWSYTNPVTGNSVSTFRDGPLGIWRVLRMRRKQERRRREIARDRKRFGW